MRENGWRVKGKSEKKYCSYKGEISPEVPNVIQRDFKADKPEVADRCDRVLYPSGKGISVPDDRLL